MSYTSIADGYVNILQLSLDKEDKLSGIPKHYARIYKSRETPILTPKEVGDSRGYHLSYQRHRYDHPGRIISRLSEELGHYPSDYFIIDVLFDYGYDVETIAYYLDYTYREVSVILDRIDYEDELIRELDLLNLDAEDI